MCADTCRAALVTEHCYPSYHSSAKSCPTYHPSTAGVQSLAYAVPNLWEASFPQERYITVLHLALISQLCASHRGPYTERKRQKAAIMNAIVSKQVSIHAVHAVCRQ